MRLVDGHEERLSGLEHQQVEHQGHEDAQVAGVLPGEPQHHSNHVGVPLLHPARGVEVAVAVRWSVAVRVRSGWGL